jgi:hypothetical protein
METNLLFGKEEVENLSGIGTEQIGEIHDTRLIHQKQRNP